MIRKKTRPFIHTAWTLLSVAAAVVLLISFIWVVNDFTELGLQRQQQQRTTGVWMRGDESKEPVEASVPAQDKQELEVIASL